MTTKTIENLPCEMTTAEIVKAIEELALKSSQMAAKLAELNGIEANKQQVTKQLGEDMKRVRCRCCSTKGTCGVHR